MKTLLVLLITTCVFSVAQAQESTYNRALGIKFPAGFSISYKKFLTTTNNIEAQVTIWNQGYRMSGLYEFNFYSFKNVEGLSWFVGPGAHIGFWKDSLQKNYNSRADLGIDGIIGLDYKIKNFPLNVSLDWEPSVTLVGNAGFTPSFGGIGVRYTF